MARAELKLHLSRPDAVYSPGEMIEGELRVRVLEDVPSIKLGLSRLWTLRWAEGNETASAGVTPLFEGSWKAGESHVIPFQLPALVEPVSHNGPLCALRWELAVTGWKDEEIAVRLSLREPAPRKTDAPPAPDRVLKGSGADRAAYLGCGFVFMGGLGALGVSTALSVESGWLSGLIGGLLGAGLGLPVGLAVAGMAKNEASLDAKLGAVHLTLTPPAVLPGEDVELAVEFTPLEDVLLELAEAELEGVEESNKTKHGAFTGPESTLVTTAKLLQAKKTIARAVSLRAGERVRLATTFAIPAEAPASFSHSIGKELTFFCRWGVDVKLWLQGIGEARDGHASLTVR